MGRRIVAGLAIVGLAGCAVVKSMDVTDAEYKRHRSVSVLGWPVYTRITDQEPGTSPRLVTRIEEEPVEAAELLRRPADSAPAAW